MLKFGTFQGYRHIAELFVKISYYFNQKQYLIIPQWKVFIVNCIDSIYADHLGGIVIWYLKRWPGFDSQPELVLFIVNSFQLIIKFFNFCSKNLYVLYLLLNFHTEYQIRKYVQLCWISSATFLQFFIPSCWFGHSWKNPILGYI